MHSATRMVGATIHKTVMSSWSLRHVGGPHAPFWPYDVTMKHVVDQVELPGSLILVPLDELELPRPWWPTLSNA